MKKEDIHLSDWKRIIIGEAPVQFLIETGIRTFIIFTFLLLIMKLLGKRMSGQTTINEMSVIVTLGAIVAPAMQLPDKGLLIGMTILITILALQKFINYLGIKSDRIERLIHGDMNLIVKDGTLIAKNMNESRITRHQIFTQLRKKNIHDLSKVKRVYVEACGLFSIYEQESNGINLPILPDLSHYESTRH